MAAERETQYRGKKKPHSGKKNLCVLYSNVWQQKAATISKDVLGQVLKQSPVGARVLGLALGSIDVPQQAYRRVLLGTGCTTAGEVCILGHCWSPYPRTAWPVVKIEGRLTVR